MSLSAVISPRKSTCNVCSESTFINPLAKKLRLSVLHPSIVRTHLRQIALQQFQALLARCAYELRYARGDQQREISKCRARLAPFCVGYGLDVPGVTPYRSQRCASTSLILMPVVESIPCSSAVMRDVCIGSPTAPWITSVAAFQNFETKASNCGGASRRAARPKRRFLTSLQCD
jgi:hypothetical protein